MQCENILLSTEIRCCYGNSILMRARYPSRRARDSNVNIGPCQIRVVFSFGTHGSMGGAQGLNAINPSLYTGTLCDIPEQGEKQGPSYRDIQDERVPSTLLKKV